jgi:hypothetical protein
MNVLKLNCQLKVQMNIQKFGFWSCFKMHTAAMRNSTDVSFSLVMFYDCICLFACLWPPQQFFSYPAAVTIAGDRTANLCLCLALMAFSSGGSFSCYTYCNMGPRFIQSHPKDRYPRPTVRFEPGT